MAGFEISVFRLLIVWVYFVMSFSLLLIFVFFVFWRPQEWLVPGLYGWPILDVVVFVSVLLMMIEWDSGKIPIDKRRPQYFLLGGLFFSAIMSHLANTYIQGLIDNWIDAFRICFFGLLFFTNMTSISRLRIVTRIFVIMAIFMCFHALLQQTRGYGFGGLEPIMSWRPDLDYKVPRSLFFGIFGDPNDLAQLFATAMPLSFLFLKKKSFIGICIGVAYCWYMYQGIESCWSRGSLLGCIAAIITVFVMWWGPKKLYSMTLSLGACALLIAISFSGAWDGSAMDRVNFWGEANRIFVTKPIFGVGLGMIREYISDSRALHNAYVTAYSELGVFGYFFWFSLLMVAMNGMSGARRVLLEKVRTPDEEWLLRFTVWGMAGLCSFATTSFFLSRAFVFPLFFLLAMCGSVPFLVERDNDSEYPVWAMDIKQTLKMGIPISLGSIVYIYYAIIMINKTR